MSGGSDYTKYASRAPYEPQSLYLDSGSAFRTFNELRSLGTRRIMLLCSLQMRKFKVVEDLVKALEKDRFRVFDFSRSNVLPVPDDINSGLRLYREYNCDTIITIGGSADIDCGKFISAMAVNSAKDISEFEGVGRIRNDISVLCSVMTENSPEVSSSVAKYYDPSAGRWVTCASSFLIPQMVVNDTDFSARTDVDLTTDSALGALARALEAYISPRAAFNPMYRANAINTLSGIIGNILKFRNDTDNSYLRRQIATGAIYAGMADRHTGPGISEFMTNVISAGYEFKCGLLRLMFLTEILDRHISDVTPDIAAVAKALHLCTKNSDDTDAASTFIENLRRLCERNGSDDIKADIPEKTLEKYADQVRRESQVFDPSRISSSEIKDIFVRILTA